LLRSIPVAAAVFAQPVQPVLLAGKWRGGESEFESAGSVRNIGHDPVNHPIGALDERFPQQPARRIIEDPHAVVFVRENDVDGVGHAS
jgi:hypothetical protein